MKETFVWETLSALTNLSNKLGDKRRRDVGFPGIPRS